jgi:RNA-directed DNA polymerase
VKTVRREEPPAEVPETKATQAGDIRARWAWTQPAVWTDRMLAALETGVRGGVWFSLVDKVIAPRTLAAAFERVEKNHGAAGADHVTVEMFGQRLDERLTRLERELRDGTYRPQPVRRVWIDKPGSAEKRPLGIPTVRDRVVQTALRAAMEPIFEREFAEHSYGFRPGRGCKDALRRVDSLLKQGCTWVVDADLRKYFDSIPHDRLMERVRSRVADGRVLALIEGFLKQGVLEEMNLWTPDEGTPQGAVISPLLSNLYLDPLDHAMASAGVEMVRYADDFVLLCRSEADANAALEKVREWTAQAGLTLHSEKTRVVDATQRGGFDFLGYHFERAMRWPRKKSEKKFRDAIRAKTRRNNGHSLRDIIDNVNSTVRGWYGYFKHSHWTTFPCLDKWIRMRLRSILRGRIGLKGRGRGSDHQRWPNAFFVRYGLFSLKTAHTEERQSSQR